MNPGYSCIYRPLKLNRKVGKSTHVSKTYVNYGVTTAFSFPSSGPEQPPMAAAGFSTTERVCWSLQPRSPTGPCWCYLQGHHGARGWSGTWTDDCCQGSVQGMFSNDEDGVITAFLRKHNGRNSYEKKKIHTILFPQTVLKGFSVTMAYCFPVWYLIFVPL